MSDLDDRIAKQERWMAELTRKVKNAQYGHQPVLLNRLVDQHDAGWAKLQRLEAMRDSRRASSPTPAPSASPSKPPAGKDKMGLGTFVVACAVAAVCVPALASLDAPSAPRTIRTTTGCNLRAGRSTSTGVLDVIPEGTELLPLGARGGWRKVEYGSKTGWIGRACLK